MGAAPQTGLLEAGGILLTGQDLHEAPWGDASQLDGMIAEGFVGDGVLLPEYLCDRLPAAGRGLAIFQIKLTRKGEPVHEVLGGMEAPSVIGAGAELIGRLRRLDSKLSKRTHKMAGRESVFVGKATGGEIYNQAPVQFDIAGTRRWIPGTSVEKARKNVEKAVRKAAKSFDVDFECTYQIVRDAYEIDVDEPLPRAFQAAYRALEGKELPIGPKPFVDDGNAFVSRGRICAITHGPNAKGAHTVNEEVPIAELSRVAAVYALTALAFCQEK